MGLKILKKQLEWAYENALLFPVRLIGVILISPILLIKEDALGEITEQ